MKDLLHSSRKSNQYRFPYAKKVVIKQPPPNYLKALAKCQLQHNAVLQFSLLLTDISSYLSDKRNKTANFSRFPFEIFQVDKTEKSQSVKDFTVLLLNCRNWPTSIVKTSLIKLVHKFAANAIYHVSCKNKSEPLPRLYLFKHLKSYTLSHNHFTNDISTSQALMKRSVTAFMTYFKEMCHYNQQYNISFASHLKRRALLAHTEKQMVVG